jgi:hypothetical protein
MQQSVISHWLQKRPVANHKWFSLQIKQIQQIFGNDIDRFLAPTRHLPVSYPTQNNNAAPLLRAMRHRDVLVVC